MKDTIMKNKWNGTIMAILVIGTLILSPLGIIAGGMNIKYSERKTQSYVLLIIGIIITVLWIIHFSGHHH